MLNSLASLFWGSSTNDEQENAANDTAEQHYGNGEHLETQQDEDWVVVRTADKENSLECAHLGPPHRLHHIHHTHHHNNYHSVQQTKCCFSGGHESVPHNLSGPFDADHLDDAAALARSLSMEDNGCRLTDSDSALCSLIDCGWVNHELDKNSDTESIPESVFSASSCRSHATYHPGGNQSEPWVVAPPPCFTGSQTGELVPTASSPLENLLIEHPSMSVYLSFPLFHPLISNRPSGENIIISQHEEETENRDSNGQPLVNDDGQPREETNVLQQRNNIIHAAVHPGLVSAEQLVKSIRLAQRMQLNKAQKHISKSKCERQNKVRECNSHGKGSSRRNKLIHPSGVCSSRFSQRF